MSTDLPQAEVVPRSRLTWLAYCLPIVAVLGVGGYLLTALGGQGPLIHIYFDDGHGIAVGNPLKHRGINAGTVESVALDPGMQGVTVGVRLRADAADLAREESRFWIVRPEFGFSGVEGLDTLLGPKTIGVLPGAGVKRRIFKGETQPPILERMIPGGVDIILQASNRGSLSPGSPVTYRQVTIGRILAVNLASDGSAVEARAYIEPQFSAIIRSNSVFWNTSGIRIDIGLGVQISAESLETLVTGGVAVATPDTPGSKATNGARFTLATEADEDWLTWRPSLTTSGVDSKKAAPMPWPAVVTWDEGRLWTSKETRSGWVLPLPEGLLGPTNLLGPQPQAHPGTLALSVNDSPVDPASEASKDKLALLLRRPAGTPLAPHALRRGIRSPEDVSIVRPDMEAVPLAAARQKQEGNASWRCQDLNLDASWHGAPAVAHADNRIIGLMIQDNESWLLVAIP